MESVLSRLARFRFRAITAISVSVCSLLPSGLSRPEAAGAQTNPEAAGPTQIHLPRRSFGSVAGFRLEGPARPGEYLGAVGSQAAWLGFETGEGEIWAHPLKVARDLRLSFSIPQYAEPILGNQVASEVAASPGHVEVSYSHEAFVVRQHVFVPPDLPGILILLEVDAVVDLEIRVEFQPVLQYAWPGGFGGQYLFWDQETRAFVLSESLQERNAVIGSPWATRASAHPAHRLAEAPSVFVIPVDRDRAEKEFIPIGIAAATAPREEVLSTYWQLFDLDPFLPLVILERGSDITYKSLHFHAKRKTGEPPLPSASSASAAPGDPSTAVPAHVIEWAKINLAEQRVCNPDLGCGLVAGWGPSGTSLRPGFGWFFGGDAAINTLAMDATGQWADVAEALRFLARYQREDGKIPHEISQAAGQIPWFEDFPYAYYHADTTPYWMLALWHYWRASGDDSLLQELWPAYERAYRWCLSVETDGDGIIENTTGGLGAIEVGGLGEGLHQDIYLAAVWIASLQGTAEMAEALGVTVMATEANTLFARAHETLNRRYWMPQEGYHAFGILRGGGTNSNLTAWPATALAFGLLDEEEARGTLSYLARDFISSSWGARLLSTESDLYDPLHYNNGMVWPFMTGFVAWGQYRYRRPWAGYQLLWALWRLHGDWSLGRHPENLSGAFYQTLGATVPHQFFASSMMVTPLVRGLLGWEPNAPQGRATLAPQPHPEWSEFSAHDLRVGETWIDIDYRRDDEEVEVEFHSQGPEVELTYIQGIPLGARNVRMDEAPEGARGRMAVGPHDLQHEVIFTLSEGSPVRLRYLWDGGLEVYQRFAPELPRGSRSGGLRILDFRRDGESWLLTVEGEAGANEADGTVFLRGDAVETDDSRVWNIVNSRSSVIRFEFPVSGARVVKTIRLRPVREEPGG